MSEFHKNIKREIITTNDGSKTIHFPEINESYHSKHGALQEAEHVFIKSGLSQLKKSTISILEVGFGTGLNAILSYIFAENQAKIINYYGLEAFPVTEKEVHEIDYTKLSKLKNSKTEFQKLHKAEWNIESVISDNFKLTKIHSSLANFSPKEEAYDLIYFDAFGPRVQPEMWSKEVFDKLYKATRPNGIFVTYSCKGQVRRDLISAGFEVEKIPGPPGKREMLRGIKA